MTTDEEKFQQQPDEMPSKPEEVQPPKKITQEDLSFIKDCEVAELGRKNPFANIIIWLTCFFIFAFLLWSYYSNIDQVTVGQAKVLPSSRVQSIQTLDGGVLEKIFVKEDDVVKKGQILMQLDLTRYAAEYRSALAKSQALEASIARLNAQAEHAKEIVFPESIVKNRPDLIVREKELFHQKTDSYNEALFALNHKSRLVNTQLDILTPLAKEGLVSKLEVIRLEGEAAELKGQVDKAENDYRDDALSQIDKMKSELESVGESLTALKDRTEKATIRSSVEGIVNKINIHTVGGVVKPGDTLMEIVPVDANVLIDARLTPQEVAFIHQGQAATVKITAYDYSIYGGLHGVVQSIGADTIADEKGNQFFHVMIKTTNNYLEHDGKRLPIIPGMTATVHIMTGKQSILKYLLKPIIKAKSNALTER